MRLFLILLICLTFLNIPQPAAADNKINYRPLIIKWKQQIEHQKGVYGIFLIDINTGCTAGINETKQFHAASTIKLPINLYLYKQISRGHISSSTKLTYLAKHHEEGTGYLKNMKIGSCFTIAELSRASIIYSDNVAINILYDYLGRTNVKNYMRKLGGRVVQNESNTTCPKDMALYMNEIAKFAQDNSNLGGVLIHHLENTVFKERIPAGIPANIKVANKIGNWPPTGTYNDVALVQHPKKPYILAVFSKNTASKKDAFRTIRKISRLTFEFQANLK